MPTVTSEQVCSLCHHSLSLHAIRDGERGFCCVGCHAVFNILSLKNELTHYRDHPLFQKALSCGLISNPALLEEIKKSRTVLEGEEREKLYLEIQQMWCPSCAEVIKLLLMREKGVIHCVVDYSSDLAAIEFSPRYLSQEKIFDLIKALGYVPSFLHTKEKKTVSLDLYLRFGVAIFCSMNIMMFSYPIYASYFELDEMGYAHLFAWLSFFASLPVIGYSGWPIFHRFLSSLRVRIFGMETLVTMGVLSAFGLSLYELLRGTDRVYFDSMTVIITLVLLGKIIETKAKFSAKDTLLRLTKSLPKRGRKKLADGSVAFVPLKEVIPGDILVAFTGEKIVLDGVVIEGEGCVNEALMTGEALPATKQVGSTLLGGSILQQGVLTFQVTSKEEQSALHKIIALVEKGLEYRKTGFHPKELPVNLIVRWLIPTVLLVAFATASFCWFFGIAGGESSAIQTAIIRAVSVLLISCPCAIGIAAPLAESHLMNALAKRGAIVRNRGCLAKLGEESVVVCDKTGTITEGHFRVVDGLNSLSNQELGALKGLASHSTHPMASAIAEAVEERPLAMIRVEEVAGKGIKGMSERTTYLLGSRDFMEQEGVDLSQGFSYMAGGATATSFVYFSINRNPTAILTLVDCIREGAKEFILSLAPTHTILLSGDGSDCVEAVAKECYFDDWRARCTPLEKQAMIHELRKKEETVMVLGDGINDAPALTAADIGVSVISATDISIQVSDILLTTDRLAVVSEIRLLAKRGRTILKQNLFWAFFYNVIGVALAAFGYLSPLFAAFAMVISSLIVLLNAQRLDR